MEKHISNLTPDILNQNPHGNKISVLTISTLKFAKHSFGAFTPWGVQGDSLGNRNNIRMFIRISINLYNFYFVNFSNVHDIMWEYMNKTDKQHVLVLRAQQFLV